MVSPSSFNTDQKLELLLWQSIQQSKQLTEIQEALVTVSNEQADYNQDIADLTAFLTALPAQIAAAIAALQAQGVTDLSALDALKADADAITPTLANLPGATPPAPGGSTPA
jgi:predicted  nucleic acid-binding Zn-ribbon protein